ncbi:MAG: TldD/PmbA family protein [Candidatus Nezhaarchaeota archaeon]|nr:TldD/PmbA family protein [Candidatus Nezhaarchaeota archaeon]
MSLLDACRNMIDEALKEGANACEAYGVDVKSIRIDLRKGEIRTAKVVHDVGVGFRALVRGSLGYSYTTSLNVDLHDVAKKAVKAAKAGYPDPDFVGLTNPSSYQTPRGTYDKRIASMTQYELVELCKLLAREANIAGVFSVNVLAESSVFKCFVVNSNGVEGTDEGTSFQVTIYVTAKDGTRMSSSYEGNAVRSIDAIRPEELAVKAAREAVEGLKAQHYRTSRVPVILAGEVMLPVIVGGIASALNADLVQRGRSFMASKLNSKVGPEELTIIDDGLIDGGLLTRKFDVEGCPRKSTVLVDKGVVKNLLHNSYTAGKAGLESTGNASRSGGELDFRGQVTVAPSNVLVKPGDWSLDEMISEVKNGLLILNTSDVPNIATGDLSAMVTHGYIIDKGEIGTQVKETLFALNILELMEKAKAVGKEVSRHYNLYSPPLLLSDVQVSSKA